MPATLFSPTRTTVEVWVDCNPYPLTAMQYATAVEHGQRCGCGKCFHCTVNKHYIDWKLDNED